MPLPDRFLIRQASLPGRFLDDTGGGFYRC